METRDILDPDGNIVGTLTMPDGLSEDKWAELLAPYARRPEDVMLVLPRRFRLSIVGCGHDLMDIDTYINAMLEPDKTYYDISWNFSKQFHRRHEMVPIIQAALSLTEEQVDEIFELAAGT